MKNGNEIQYKLREGVIEYSKYLSEHIEKRVPETMEAIPSESPCNAKNMVSKKMIEPVVKPEMPPLQIQVLIRHLLTPVPVQVTLSIYNVNIEYLALNMKKIMGRLIDKILSQAVHVEGVQEFIIQKIVVTPRYSSLEDKLRLYERKHSSRE